MSCLVLMFVTQLLCITLQVLFGRVSSQETMSLSHLVNLKVCCHSHGDDDEIIINVNCKCSRCITTAMIKLLIIRNIIIIIIIIMIIIIIQVHVYTDPFKNL